MKMAIPFYRKIQNGLVGYYLFLFSLILKVIILKIYVFVSYQNTGFKLLVEDCEIMKWDALLYMDVYSFQGK